MVTAAWIAALVTALIWIVGLRLTVRVFGRGADNGWDNALGYLVASVALAFLARWLLLSGSVFVIALIPAVVWVGQTIALKVIYELRPVLAWWIGTVHAFFAGTIITSLAVVAGFVAAYILYGKIISDPMILVRLILRLIGVWPAGAGDLTEA